MKKSVGKVIDYNGSSGTIINEEGNKIIFSQNNVISNDLQEGDYVTYNTEVFKTIEVEEKIATFIKKVNKLNEKWFYNQNYFFN